MFYTPFFYKNLVYKNIKDTNGPKIKNILKTEIQSRSRIWSRKRWTRQLCRDAGAEAIRAMSLTGDADAEPVVIVINKTRTWTRFSQTIFQILFFFCLLFYFFLFFSFFLFFLSSFLSSTLSLFYCFFLFFCYPSSISFCL